MWNPISLVSDYATTFFDMFIPEPTDAVLGYTQPGAPIAMSEFVGEPSAQLFGHMASNIQWNEDRFVEEDKGFYISNGTQLAEMNAWLARKTVMVGDSTIYIEFTASFSSSNFPVKIEGLHGNGRVEINIDGHTLTSTTIDRIFDFARCSVDFEVVDGVLDNTSATSSSYIYLYNCIGETALVELEFAEPANVNGYGIYIERSTNVIFESCVFTGEAQRNIRIDDASRVLCAEVEFGECHQEQIYMRYGSTVIFDELNLDVTGSAAGWGGSDVGINKDGSCEVLALDILDVDVPYTTSLVITLGIALRFISFLPKELNQDVLVKFPAYAFDTTNLIIENFCGTGSLTLQANTELIDTASITQDTSFWSDTNEAVRIENCDIKIILDSLRIYGDIPADKNTVNILDTRRPHIKSCYIYRANDDLDALHFERSYAAYVDYSVFGVCKNAISAHYSCTVATLFCTENTITPTQPSDYGYEAMIGSNISADITIVIDGVLGVQNVGLGGSFWAS